MSKIVAVRLLVHVLGITITVLMMGVLIITVIIIVFVIQKGEVILVL